MTRDTNGKARTTRSLEIPLGEMPPAPQDSGNSINRVYSGRVLTYQPGSSRGAVFTTGQVARILRVAPRTVSKWFEAGEFNFASTKGYRLPMCGDRRIPREALILFMRKRGFPLDEVPDADGVFMGLYLHRPVQGLTTMPDFEAGIAIGNGAVTVLVVGCAYGLQRAKEVIDGVRSSTAVEGQHKHMIATAIVLGEDTPYHEAQSASRHWDHIFKWEATDKEITEWCEQARSNQFAPENPIGMKRKPADAGTTQLNEEQHG